MSDDVLPLTAPEINFLRRLYHLNACPDCAEKRAAHNKLHNINAPHNHGPSDELMCSLGQSARVPMPGQASS